jgi:hypothetical protein
MLNVLMFAAIVVNQVPVDGSTVYVPRTEVRVRTEVVPRVVYDKVEVEDQVTVYDRYKQVWVPDGTVGAFQTQPSVVGVPVRRGLFGRPSVVEKFKYKLRMKGY